MFPTEDDIGHVTFGYSHLVMSVFVMLVIIFTAMLICLVSTSEMFSVCGIANQLHQV